MAYYARRMYQCVVEVVDDSSTILSLGDEIGDFVVPSDAEIEHWKYKTYEVTQVSSVVTVRYPTAKLCGVLAYPDSTNRDLRYVYFTLPVSVTGSECVVLEADAWNKVEPYLVDSYVPADAPSGIVNAYEDAKVTIDVGIDRPGGTMVPSSEPTTIYAGTAPTSSSVQVAVEGISYDVRILTEKLNKQTIRLDRALKHIAELYNILDRQVDVDTI